MTVLCHYGNTISEFHPQNKHPQGMYMAEIDDILVSLSALVNNILNILQFNVAFHNVYFPLREVVLDYCCYIIPSRHVSCCLGC